MDMPHVDIELRLLTWTPSWFSFHVLLFRIGIQLFQVLVHTVEESIKGF